MKKIDIKNLAKHSFINGKVHPKIIKFVMQNLPKSDLREYLFYLKKEIKIQTIYVKTAQALDQQHKKSVEEIFVNKNVVYDEDESIGAGVIINEGDNMIDASIKGYIDQAIEKLKD